MKLSKQVVLPTGTVLAPGTELQFSSEGFAHYNKEAVSIYSIPTSCIEMGAVGTESLNVVQAFAVGKTVIPVGTKLQFSTEGFANYGKLQLDRSKIPSVALESDEEGDEGNDAVTVEEVEAPEGSDVAETVIGILNADFPEGFTKGELADSYGDKIDGCDYSIHEVDENVIMIVKDENDKSAEIYLTEEDGTYKPTGEFHAISEVELVATESFFSRIRGTRAAKKNARRGSIEAATEAAKLDDARAQKILDIVIAEFTGEDAGYEYKGKQGVIIRTAESLGVNSEDAESIKPIAGLVSKIMGTMAKAGMLSNGGNTGFWSSFKGRVPKKMTIADLKGLK